MCIRDSSGSAPDRDGRHVIELIIIIAGRDIRALDTQLDIAGLNRLGYRTALELSLIHI